VPRRGADQENATFANRIDEVTRGRSDPVVTDLVTRAGNGDKQAWDALVERYAPLIWSICRRHGLGGAGTEDVAQSVWLMLVNRLGTGAIRPRFPVGWPPPPGANAAVSRVRRGDRTTPGVRQTPRPSGTSRP
jgi:DNA-directed RNA polymerase specialized sigma24 family protein